MNVPLKRKAAWGVSGLCRAKCHWDVWNTTLCLLTHPQRSHWLWQVAWRCQEIVISFIMWKISTALRSALCFSSLCFCQKGRAERFFSNALSSCRTFSDLNFVFSDASPHRIECPMSKSEANQRSPRMVKEPHKTVSSAAVDVTSGSKVSITVSRISEAKHLRVVCHIFTPDPEIYHVTRFTAKSDPRKTIYLYVLCVVSNIFRGDRCCKSFLDGCWC